MDDDEERRALARQVLEACVTTAREAMEDAGIRGLCPEGQLEVVMAVLQNLSVKDLIDGSPRPG
jgi:hypothetical protein